MKNLKKSQEMNLNLFWAVSFGFVELGGGGSGPRCPKYMHMEESVAYCDPAVNPSDDCKPKCVND